MKIKKQEETHSIALPQVKQTAQVRVNVAAICTYVSANFIVKHLLYLIWIVTFMQYM